MGDIRKSQTKQDNSDYTKNWLEILRNNSWELELLFTGFVLVGLFQLPEYWEKLYANLSIETHDSFFLKNFIPLFIKTLQFNTNVLIINLIAFLILRGFWIGIVGLSSAFPHGAKINYSKLNKKFQQFFKNKLSNYENSILQLDKICSSIFAFTFLILSMSIALLTFNVLMWTLNLFFNYIGGIVSSPLSNIIFDLMGVIFFIILFLVILVFIDFITLGKLKKIKYRWFANSFYYVSRFFSLITLSFVFRPIYYSLLTNISKKLSVFILILYSILIFLSLTNFSYSKKVFFPTKQDSNYELMTRCYENISIKKNKYFIITTPIIQSEMITKGDFVKLFIPYYAANNSELQKINANLKQFRRHLESSSSLLSYEPLSNQIKSKDRALALKCFNDMYTVTLNDSVLSDLEFKFYRHHNNGELGIITYIDTYSLDRGKNQLIIENSKWYFNIPFWIK